MWKHVFSFLFICLYCNGVSCRLRQSLVQIAEQQNVISTSNYVFWPNATVPFYVNTEHFDHEQTLKILTALSMLAFKTCLKFAPVMAAPASSDHVLVFENSNGVRRCVFDTLGHSVFEPHRVTLGYECMDSPQIDMVLMRILGLPFEHNRRSRGGHIEVLNENIEPGSMELFTRAATEPNELALLPYDVNSALHFGARDFSKNGHRTIIFKDPNMIQNRVGLTKTDLKKIEVIYGSECRVRDREEKLQLCQSYPGVARKKRDIDLERLTSKLGRMEGHLGLSIDIPSEETEFQKRRKRDAEKAPVTKSLRVNPNITPPSNITAKVKDTLAELGIEESVKDVVEQGNKLSALALKNARAKYCNSTKPNLRTIVDLTDRENADTLGITEIIVDYVQGIVNNAIANLTIFCEEAESIDVYLRSGCMYNDGSNRCRQNFKSTHSGDVRYSTKHRPVYKQSTHHRMRFGKKHWQRMGSGDESDEATTISTETETSRRKRGADTIVPEEVKDGADKNLELEVTLDKDAEGKRDSELKTEVENTEGKDNVVLTSEATTPGIEENLDARRTGFFRARHSEEREEDSSLSIESDKPAKKKKLVGSADIVDIKKQPEESAEVEDIKKQPEESAEVEDIKKQRAPSGKESKKKHHRKPKEEEEEIRETTQQINKKKRGHKAKKVNVEEVEEAEYTTESPKKKKPRKEPQRSSVKPKVVKLSKQNDEFYKDRQWPGGVLHYVIQQDTTYDVADLRRRLSEVRDVLREKTCVSMKELSEEQASSYEDYIVISDKQDYVTGRVGGKQLFGSIELFRGGQHRQHTAMMVMAMLGFYFEVSRHDRDKYVRVHMRHVRPDKLHHFEKIRDDATLPLPYDYKSATHPAWQYWRQIGRTGISTVATYKDRDPDGSVMKSLGQNSKLLSDIDIMKINSVYGVKCFNKKSKGKGAKQKLRQKGQNKEETSA